MDLLYEAIAKTLQAYKNCCLSDTEKHREWKLNHADRLTDLVHHHMPSGSGVDNGTVLDMAKSNGEKLVFEAGFHHMNKHGVYDGWTHHTVVVTASLLYRINVRISGRNRNDIKEYLASLFLDALMKEI